MAAASNRRDRELAERRDFRRSCSRPTAHTKEVTEECPRLGGLGRALRLRLPRRCRNQNAAVETLDSLAAQVGTALEAIHVSGLAAAACDSLVERRRFHADFSI